MIIRNALSGEKAGEISRVDGEWRVSGTAAAVVKNVVRRFRADQSTPGESFDCEEPIEPTDDDYLEWFSDAAMLAGYVVEEE